MLEGGVPKIEPHLGILFGANLIPILPYGMEWKYLQNNGREERFAVQVLGKVKRFSKIHTCKGGREREGGGGGEKELAMCDSKVSSTHRSLKMPQSRCQDQGSNQ